MNREASSRGYKMENDENYPIGVALTHIWGLQSITQVESDGKIEQGEEAFARLSDDDEAARSMSSKTNFNIYSIDYRRRW